METALDELRETIAAGRVGGSLIETVTEVGELTLVAPLEALLDVVSYLRSDANCRFTTLVDITAVDWPSREKRFDLVYHFLSMHLNQRIRLRVPVGDGEIAPSVLGEFPNANWYEREVFDMYGILFSGHPDLRRILTDYGFAGHPLRKDFPTTGYVEVRYSEEQKRVIYEPVKLTQEYRQFDFMSPWEGADYILPGDEKKGA